MALPKLPALFDKKPKVEYFLALLLRDEKVSALIVEQAQGKITIIGKHEAFFKTNLEHAAEEEFTQILDTAISGAEETIPANVEVKNTIFGVKDTWVEDKSIKKEYLSKLKGICHQLDLTPMGFIVIAEALAHLIQKEEGAPLSALLTEIGKYSVTVSLFRAGKLIEARHTSIEDTPMATVDSLLKKFEKVEILPSRIILFHAGIADSNEDKADVHDSLAQKFIAHQWSKSLPFLHVPQVSILPSGFDGKAIVTGAATQLGYEMVGLPVDMKDIGIKTYEKHHAISPEKAVEKEQTDEQAIEEKEQTAILSDTNLPVASLSKVTADNFGFVKDQDISHAPGKSIVEEDAADENSEKKIEHTKHIQNERISDKDDKTELEDDEDEMEEDLDEDTIKDDSHAKKRKTSLSTTALLSTILAPFNRIKLPRRAKPFGGRLMLFIPLVLLLIIGVLFLYIFKLQATVALVVAPKMIDETQRIIFSASAENEFSQNVIAAKEITVSLDGTASTNATGQKEIGEKSKGTVTVYNSDNAKKTLNAGTVITSSNGMDFLTDKEVSIASASGDIFTGVKSGTAQVTVTAKNIGNEYNLPSNTKFTVAGSGDLAAKNDSAFSGGSKKKVTVVAKKDTDKLLADLPKSLEQKAREQLNAKVGNNEVLLTGFTDQTIEKKEFDKDVNEEASSVKLTSTVKFTAVAYNKDDIIEYSQTVLKNKYSQDQTIPEQDIKTAISGVREREDQNINAVLDIKAGLLPRLDTPKIAKNITGKSYTEVQEYVKSLPQVERAEISLSPGLPFLPKFLPRMTENIIIVVKSS